MARQSKPKQPEAEKLPKDETVKSDESPIEPKEWIPAKFHKFAKGKI